MISLLGAIGTQMFIRKIVSNLFKEKLNFPIELKNRVEEFRKKNMEENAEKNANKHDFIGIASNSMTSLFCKRWNPSPKSSSSS